MYNGPHQRRGTLAKVSWSSRQHRKQPVSHVRYVLYRTGTGQLCVGVKTELQIGKIDRYYRQLETSMKSIVIYLLEYDQLLFCYYSKYKIDPNTYSK